MSKSMPVSKLQSDLRKTFGRTTTTQTEKAASRDSAATPTRQSGTPAKRMTANARTRRGAVTGSRGRVKPRTRKSAEARRKLTCPVDPRLYKSLQRESLEMEMPIREIIESMLKERYADESR